MTGRSIGGWILEDSPGGPSARVVGSVWVGSFGLWTLPNRGLSVALASNVEFNQPLDLIRHILELLGPTSR